MVREYNFALYLWKVGYRYCSVVDRHRVDDDPDPTFDFDADLDLIRNVIKTMQILMRVLP